MFTRWYRSVILLFICYVRYWCTLHCLHYRKGSTIDGAIFEYQRYMLHDLYPLWDWNVITEPFQRSYCEYTALLYWFYPIRIQKNQIWMTNQNTENINLCRNWHPLTILVQFWAQIFKCNSSTSNITPTFPLNSSVLLLRVIIYNS